MIIFKVKVTLNARINNTVVWEKFTVGYFCMKVVRGKIFLSRGVSDKNFLTMEYF